MPDANAPPPQPPFIDDPQCREAYPETVQVLLDTGGLIRIELCVYRWTRELPIQPDRMTPIARIAMPVGLAVILRDQLSNSLDALQKHVELVQAPAASQTKQ